MKAAINKSLNTATNLLSLRRRKHHFLHALGAPRQTIHSGSYLVTQCWDRDRSLGHDHGHGHGHGLLVPSNLPLPVHNNYDVTLWSTPRHFQMK